MSLNRISTINVHEAQPNVEEEPVKIGNRALGTNASYWNLLHIFTILAFSALVLSPQLLIPRHNSIYYPNYWHEIIIVIVVATFCLSMRTLMEFIVFTKEKSLLKIGVLLKIAACFIVPLLFVVYSLDIFWTLIMGFEHPMPLQGMLGYFVALSVYICSSWYMIMFPSKLRMNNEVKSKMKTYVIYELWWSVINLQREMLSFVFKRISSKLQFLIALLIPATKEMNKRILLKLVSKMVRKDDEVANILLSVRINIHYSLLIAIRLNGAETLTVIGMIVIDFIMHLWITRQIIQLRKKLRTEHDQNKAVRMRRDKAIMKLLLAELVEGLVPLAYASGFAMAYYGPNGHLTGDVLSDIWTYEKVENVERLFFIQFLLFGVDSASAILNAFLLSKLGNVNLIKEFCKLIKGHWIILAIQLANTITVYFAFKDINTGQDMTMKFEWISNEGRLRFIYNSTYLSDNEKKILLSNYTVT